MVFSIRHKITFTYALLFVLIFLVLGIWLSGVFSQQYEENLETSMANDARLMAGLIDITDSLGLKDFTGLAGSELDVRVTVVDSQGFPLAETARPVEELENHISRPEIKAAVGGEVGISRRYSTTVKAEMLYLAAPIYDSQGRTIGALRLARSLEEISAAIGKLRMAIFWVLLVGLGVSWILGWLLARAITRPLATLTRKARDFGKGNFINYKEIPANDEIGELELVFNDMATDILRSMAVQDLERTQVEQILRYLPVGVLVIGENGLLLAVNNFARELLDANPSGENMPLTHLTRNWQVNNFVKALLSTKEDRQQEIVITKDSQILYIRMRGAIVKRAQDGSQGEVVVVLQDVTDLRVLEQQRKDLVANVSHELRTPLTAIQGFSETLLDEMVDENTTRHFLNIIRQESLRLSRLLNDLLNLSRLEGSSKRKLGICNLREVTEAVVKLLNELAIARGKELLVAVPQDIDVNVDSGYVEQILMNYIDNAIKYTPQGTKIQVDAEIQDNGFVRVVVLDTGPGIALHAQKRLFERFYRLEKSRGGEAGSTGLGLAIVKHIVEGFGGKVGVVSHPGSGTSFWATLPLNNK